MPVWWVLQLVAWEIMFWNLLLYQWEALLHWPVLCNGFVNGTPALYEGGSQNGAPAL